MKNLIKIIKKFFKMIWIEIKKIKEIIDILTNFDNWRY